MNKQIITWVQSRSLKPYVWIFEVSLLALIIGIAFNVSIIGAIFGGSLAAVFPEYDPIYFIGVISIYSIRRPNLCLITVFCFAILYQIYLVEFDNDRRVLGLSGKGYLSTNRIYGGILLLSLIGSCHYFIIKLNGRLNNGGV